MEGMRWMLLLVVLCLVAQQGLSLRTFKQMPCNNAIARNQFRPNRSKYVNWSEKFRNLRPGKVVVIPCGEAVYVDKRARIPVMKALIVEGLLEFDPQDGRKRIVEADYVLVKGFLRAGLVTKPYSGRTSLTFVLKNISNPGPVINPSDLHPDTRTGPALGRIECGSKSFCVVGGQVEFQGLHTKCISRVSTQLLKTAGKGMRKIVVEASVAECWKNGSDIVIASSDHHPDHHERRKIVGRRVNGREAEIYLNIKLRFDHFGRDESFVVNNLRIQPAAEVIMLNRPIRIEGKMKNQDDDQGGHFMIAHTRLKQRIFGVELVKLGQQGKLGRYPFHIHWAGSVNRGSELAGCSVYKSFQRGYVIHNTNNFLLNNNVAFDVFGHGYMVGEGHFSFRNVVRGNVGIYFRSPKKLISASTDKLVTGLWIGNPENFIRTNRISGSAKTGIWFENTPKVEPALRHLPGAKTYEPMYSPILQFKDNVSHSNGDHGLRMYPEIWEPAGSRRNKVTGFVGYRNRACGLLFHAHKGTTVEKSVFFDNLVCGIDVDRTIDAHLLHGVVIGKSRLRGSVCPNGPGVDLHPYAMSEGVSGAHVVRYYFDGFRGCEAARPLGLDHSDERRSTDIVPTSTIIRRSIIADGAAPIDIMRGVDYYNSWFNKVAIRFQGFAGVANGFVVTPNDFMKAQRSQCVAKWGGYLCKGACYRTVYIFLPNVPAKRYHIRVTKVSTGKSIMLKKPKEGLKPKYMVNLETKQKYDVEIMIIGANPGAVPLPPMLEVDMGDDELACGGTIKLQFWSKHANFGDWVHNYGQKVAPTGNCAASVGGRPLGYARCEKDRIQQRVLAIPGGPLPYTQARKMRSPVTPRVQWCNSNRCLND